MIQVPQKLPRPILKDGKRIKIYHKYQKGTNKKQKAVNMGLTVPEANFYHVHTKVLTWTYILQLISYISSNSVSVAGLESSPVTKSYNINSNVGEVL